VKVEAVIFDWDGTLVDLDARELQSINKALASVGLPTISISDYIERYYSHPYKDFGARSLLRKVISNEKAVEKAIEIYSHEFWNTGHLIKLQEKAFDVLRSLKHRGLSLAVATLRRRRMLVEQELLCLKINEFVDALVTREDIEVQPLLKTPSLTLVVKLRRRQFTKALDLLRKEPSQTMIVGDSWWDIRAAKHVRAIAVWVKTGFGAYNDFSLEKPDIKLNNLEELLEHL